MKKLLEKYLKKDLVQKSEHPTLPLDIWNYTRTTQFENAWDDITLQTRSLVTHRKTGKVVARGFPKFFNYEDPKCDMPDLSIGGQLFEKLDGSFIMLFNFEGHWVICSKGSFDTEQSAWATEYLSTYDFTMLDDSLSYCFELIHPQNRIVVDYGERFECILTGIFDKGGNEYGLKTWNNFKRVRTFPFNANFKELQDEDVENKEGYVFRMNNGYRGKIKYAEYKKLHFIKSETSPLTIWRIFRDGENIHDLIKNIPDESYDWVKETIFLIKRNYFLFKGEYITELNRILALGYKDDKDLFQAVHDSRLNANRLMTLFTNPTKFEAIIWREIKPKANKLD